MSGNRARFPPGLMGNALKNYPYPLHTPMGILDFDTDNDNDNDEFLEGFDFDGSSYECKIENWCERVMFHDFGIDVVRNEHK